MKACWLSFLFGGFLLSGIESAHSSRLNLECPAFDFTVKVELNNPLSDGEIRAVDQSKAVFLNSDFYSTKLTTECQGRGEKKSCLQIADSNYCPNPKENFRIRSISDDNDLIMIQDRCLKRWVKYRKIGESDGSINYFDEPTYFQLKNQIYAGVRIMEKPILRVFPEEVEGSSRRLELISFRRDLWRINEFDPLVGRLKVNTEDYETNEHEEFRLSGNCAAYSK